MGLRLTANTNGTGLAWTLQPSYGTSDGDFALAAGPSLWTDEQLEGLTGSGSAQESREMALSSRVGYGIHLQSGELLLTPFTELSLREAGSQHIGLGLALQTSSWNVELSSSTENATTLHPQEKCNSASPSGSNGRAGVGLRLTVNTDVTGLAWTLQPSYGASDGDMALAAGPSLWTDEQLEALTGSSSAQQSGEMALSSRVGYGIRLQSSDLLLTSFTEVRFREAGSQHIGLGLALEGNSWNVELSSSTENTANSSPTTKTELNFSKRL